MPDPLAAARLLADAFRDGRLLDDLPDEARPRDRAEGYAAQRHWAARFGAVGGWKIAATSLAGQEHIGVSGPLAGPILADRVHASGASVSLQRRAMRVAECEVVFRFGRAVAPRAEPWSVDEVLAAVDGVAPGIEVPESRFRAFEHAGEAQLIADCACANEMVLGAFLPVDARAHGLASLAVRAVVDDGRVLDGVGSNVLGDPRIALAWLANELGSTGRTLEAGQFVTTGACVVPIPVQPGRRVTADFGWLGGVEAVFE